MFCPLGTRVRSTFDFGHVTLEISGLRENDSGIYTCKAVNRVGEATSTCNIKVFGQCPYYEMVVVTYSRIGRRIIRSRIFILFCAFHDSYTESGYHMVL